jgi:CubicO group peptidase (beta-lactamase class C family)
MSGRGLSKTRLARLRNVLATHVENGDVPGLVDAISRSGEAHYDTLGVKALETGELMRRDSIFRIASVTKPVAAVAALILVEECKLRLDTPIDAFIPELANRKVLKRLDGPLEDTEPAKRPINLRDLLTCRMGFGAIMEPSSEYPLQRAINDTSISVGPKLPTAATMDEYARDIGSLPWMHQPGRAWRYDTSFDVLGVLLERVAGRPLEAFMHERIFEPLGMKDTSFRIAPEKLPRLAACYLRNSDTRTLDVFDDPNKSEWSRPPGFCSCAGGLVSTVDDCLAFGRMLLDYGKHGRERILSRPSVELMTTDHITPEQKSVSPFFPGFWDNNGWGFGVGVTTRRDELASPVGSYGWAGGYGTLLHIDPREDLVGVFLSQRVFDESGLPLAFTDFPTLMYQSFDD